MLDRDRSGVGDLNLGTSGLRRPADRSRPSDLALAGWGGPACDYMVNFACVFSTTPTWGNDPRWCTPGISATEAEHNKLAADRASSAPVQGVHRYYPFVVEDRGRLGKSALTVVYIFAVSLAVRNFPGSPAGPRLHASYVASPPRLFGTLSPANPLSTAIICCARGGGCCSESLLECMVPWAAFSLPECRRPSLMRLPVVIPHCDSLGCLTQVKQTRLS
eukprot:jgi/Tetstr1/432231/TSEL_021687.t1